MNYFQVILVRTLEEKLKDGKKYAPFPWQLKEGESWTQEMRYSEAGVLKEVLALERKAVDELKLAFESADNQEVNATFRYYSKGRRMKQ